MYTVYCVYPAISKGLKQLPNFLKTAEASVVLNFSKASSVMLALILLLFLSVAQHESGTRKAISWSVTVNNKKIPVNAI